MSTLLEEFLESSALQGETLAYVEPIFQAYQQDPNSVDAHWRALFAALPQGSDVDHLAKREHFLQRLASAAAGGAESAASMGEVDLRWSDALEVYRRKGHLQADLDPLGLKRGYSEQIADIRRGVEQADGLSAGVRLPLTWSGLDKAAFLKGLEEIYTGLTAIECSYLDDEEEKAWLYQRYEALLAKSLPAETLLDIHRHLAEAELFEQFLDKKYVGQKRFSVEGGESVVPLLRCLAAEGTARYELQEMVVGMAHRGRLNVMLNVLGATTQHMCDMFDGHGIDEPTTGDVKYHLGFTTIHTYGEKTLKMMLAYNPSHLEFINPVVTGMARSSNSRHPHYDESSVLPVQVHGDASFAGQGIVSETLAMSQTRAYYVGGTVHIVINNQVGFTTDDERDSRSGVHCTDLAKGIEAPVLHVNGDHPEQVVMMAKLALEYRQRYRKDIVIDLVCYRRHGHNEADEPMMTQPVMYAAIKKHPTPLQQFKKQLVSRGVLDDAAHQAVVDDINARLKAGRSLSDHFVMARDLDHNRWASYTADDWRADYDSSFDRPRLRALGETLNTLPEGFKTIRQIDRLMKQRRAMVVGEQALNWGMAELLAYATLLDEGYRVRISGQDVRRGTFSHRFAAMVDAETGQEHMPLATISEKGNAFEIYNSLLSEAGVLGFEYGVSISDPEALVIWEAQFGDFANGAQVIIDQFISSGWQKWKRMSGLVMLLPHGQEGMGPEHSSARLERYLQLAAQNSMQVCVPSTPAQIFHLLRRQMRRSTRCPLIVMSPKSLLRHPKAVSNLDSLCEGRFELVIDDAAVAAKRCRRLVLCSGKVYYDLLAAREERKIDNVALVRVEQLYPLPDQELQQLFDRYKNTTDVVWCQEEPKNQGAWSTLAPKLESHLVGNQSVRYVGREEAASPAVGYHSVHNTQQAALIDAALAED